MQFEVPRHSLGQIAFTPPSGLFPQNYQVSMQVNLGSTDSGCVGIEERVTGENYYGFLLCSGGDWKIVCQNGNIFSLLASGKVTSTAEYTIEAAVNCSQLRLTINGVEVGSATNPRFMSTAFIGLSYANNGTNGGTVLFSNFVFMPLP